MALSNTQYDEIIREYNRIQLKNKEIQLRHIDQVYEKIPRIREINEEVASQSMNTTRILLSTNNRASIDDFRAKLSTLKNEKLTLLREYDFPEDYMELHYDCNDCKDTGYIEFQKCHCFRQKEIDILYNQSNLKNILEDQNFEKFDFSKFNDEKIDSVTGRTPAENIKVVSDICHKFIDEFNASNRQHKNLLFFGETGVGKTYLTNCIAKSLLDNSVAVIYLSAIKLFDILGSAEFNTHDVQAKGLVEQILNCDLLIIDDLGTELTNSFTNSAFFNTVNERLNNCKSTIISTNLNLPELMDRYSERITSRIIKDYTILKIYGDDLRHKRRK